MLSRKIKRSTNITHLLRRILDSPGGANPLEAEPTPNFCQKFPQNLMKLKRFTTDVVVTLSYCNKFINSNFLFSVYKGSDEIDQILMVLLSTSMFVGGLAGFILDNTIPG